MTIDMNIDPIERLKLETNNTTDLISKQIGLLLIPILEEDNQLSELYKNKTLELITNYVTEEARKRAEKGKYACPDKEVLGWAIHYIQDIKEEYTKPTIELKEEDKDKAKKEAYEEFKKAELNKLKLEEEKQKQKEAKEELKKQEKIKKYEEEHSSQMSLF